VFSASRTIFLLLSAGMSTSAEQVDPMELLLSFRPTHRSIDVCLNRDFTVSVDTADLSPPYGVHF